MRSLQLALYLVHVVKEAFSNISIDRCPILLEMLSPFRIMNKVIVVILVQLRPDILSPADSAISWPGLTAGALLAKPDFSLVVHVTVNILEIDRAS